jgi:hypothetical protein
VAVLSVAILVLTQIGFWLRWPSSGSGTSGGADKIDVSWYVVLSFGSLLFAIAGLSLPQLLKLKVGGIELEKSVSDQISPTAPTLGIKSGS